MNGRGDALRLLTEGESSVRERPHITHLGCGSFTGALAGSSRSGSVCQSGGCHQKEGAAWTAPSCLRAPMVPCRFACLRESNEDSSTMKI